MNTEQIKQALFIPPAPAPEVIEMNRANADALLVQLEGMGMSGALIDDLRMALSAPKAELWAVYSAGPGEIWPALDREQAEWIAEETTRQVNDALKERGSDLRVQNTVIPSPWAPAQHFQEVAEQMSVETLSFRQTAQAIAAERDQLAQELKILKAQGGRACA